MFRYHTSKTFFSLFILVFVGFLLVNCEKEITLDLPEPTSQIVVEGSIYSGQSPIVILNTNFPYFGTFTIDDYQSNFVRGAEVTVSDGAETVKLEEFCWSDLTEEQQALLVAFGGDSNGIIPDTIPENFDFCLYTSFPPQVLGEVGKAYTLEINTPEGENLTAITSIPEPVPFDSIWAEQHPNEEFEKYWRVYGNMTDPEELGNYYRLFTQRNHEPFYPSPRSVFDDLLINGKEFYFPLDKGQPQSSVIEIDTYGYFEAEDTIQIRWTTIDAASYDFWRTLEFSSSANGPFGGSTQVIDNIEGGFGIWCGYGVSEHELTIGGE